MQQFLNTPSSVDTVKAIHTGNFSDMCIFSLFFFASFTLGFFFFSAPAFILLMLFCDTLSCTELTYNLLNFI